jgi:hypothetical protein
MATAFGRDLRGWMIVWHKAADDPNQEPLVMSAPLTDEASAKRIAQMLKWEKLEDVDVFFGLKIRSSKSESDVIGLINLGTQEQELRDIESQRRVTSTTPIKSPSIEALLRALKEVNFYLRLEAAGEVEAEPLVLQEA